MNFIKTKILIFLFATIVLFGFSIDASAAARYWVGAANALSSSASSWSASQNSCGVGGGASVPGASDDVYFTSSCNVNATLDIVNWSIGSYTHSAGYTAITTMSAINSTTTVAGNVTINSGALTHAANTTVESYRLIMSIGGNLTLASGAFINVNNTGYRGVSGSNGAGPGDPTLSNGNCGASYGGTGWCYTTPGPTYGSITAPVNIGSSDYSTNGGGAVILSVAGSTTLHGTVSANGHATSYRGSGGSVFITTGSFLTSSTGLITANGSPGSTGSFAGGGGRVAIILTGVGQTFPVYWTGAGKVTAYGGSSGSVSGGAGTVYLEEQSQSGGHGVLVIDNNSYTSAIDHNTLLNGAVDISAFSSIIIRNKGNLAIDTGETLNLATANLTVTSSSTSYVTAGAGSSVTFPNNHTLSNYTLTMLDIATTTTAGNLTIGSGGALILGVNPVTVAGDFTVASGGYASHLVNSTTALGDKYRFIMSVNGNLTVASGGTIDATSKGYTGTAQGPGGGSNTGSYGGLSSEAHRGASLGGAIYGSITAPVNIGSSGYTGRSGGGAIILNVVGSADIDGSLRSDAVGASCIAYAAAGSVFLTTASLADSSTGIISASNALGVVNNNCGAGSGGRVSVVLTGPSQAFPSYWTQAGKMIAYGGMVDSSNSSAAGTVYQEQRDLQGAGHGTLIIDNNNLTGQLERTQTLMTGTIDLSQFSSIIIRNKGNLGIDAGESINLNSNNLAVTSSSTSFLTALSGASVSIPAGTTLNGYTMTLLTTPAATTTGDLTIGSGTLSLGTQPLAINGDLTINSGGTVTHNRNFTTALYNLRLSVLGDLVINSGGAINVSLKGFSNTSNSASGPGGGSISASHGGLGSTVSAGTAGSSYGSITAPTLLGSSPAVQYDPGGGAAILSVVGSTTLDGSILSIGNGNSGCVQAATGGSIFLTTASLTGSASAVIAANAGQSGQAGSCGSASGGGRVSVILTGIGQDFSNYLGSITAWGANATSTGASAYGSSGTVYQETASQGAGHGTLIIDNNNWSTASTPHTELGIQNTNALSGLTAVSILKGAKFAYFANSTSTFSLTSSPSTLSPTILGSTTNQSFISYRPLTIPGTTAFYGTFNASTTAVTYTGFAGASTTVAVLPGTYGDFITSNTTSGIIYQLTGDLINPLPDDYTIPCGVTIDLNGNNWSGTLYHSGNGGCGTLLYNGGTLNSVAEPGLGAVTYCTNTANLSSVPALGSVTVRGSGICTMTSHITATSTVTIMNGATLYLNGYSLNAGNLTVNTGGTLQLQGAENLSVTGTITNNGTIKYVGNGNSTADTYILKSFPSYKNLLVSFTDALDTLVSYFTTSATSGLVGYWKLDETATPALDSSGFGSSGTWTASPTANTAVSPTIRFTNPRGLTFNGTTQYLTMANPTALQITHPLTISAWIKRTATGGTRTIVGHGTNGYAFLIDSSNRLSLSKVGGTAVTSSATITDTTYWHHVAVSYDGANACLYIDGVLDSCPAYSQNFTTFGNNLYVGNDPSSSGFFNGSLDDVRIYNRALTATEISVLANGYPNEATANTSLTLTGTNTLTGGTFYAPATMTVTGAHTQSAGNFIASTTLNFASDYTQSGGSTFSHNYGTVNLTKTSGAQILSATSTALSSGLSGWWKLDDGSGTSAVDSSGNSNTGTLVSTPTWDASTPTLSVANPYSLTFNGSSQYVTTLHKIPHLATAFSMSFWMKTPASFTSGAYISRALSQYYTIAGYATRDSNNNAVLTPRLAVGVQSAAANSGIGYGNTVLSPSTWYHVGVLYDGSQPTNATKLRIFLNGSQETLTYYAPTNIPTSVYNANVASGYAVGFARDAGIAPNSFYPYFNGSLDDVRIYNRVLSSAEITTLVAGSYPVDSAIAFNNISKTTSASTLNITGGNTLTVTGTTTLKGAAGQPLTIGSTNSTQWKFDPRGALDLANLIVARSNNISASTTNLYPTISASNFSGVTDGLNNTNWVFTLPTITFSATGTQATTTPLPITNKYMGGAFAAVSNSGTSTITSIKISQAGTLPTSYITNVQLLYATSTDGMCSTSTTPITSAGAIEFGHSGAWTATSTTILGSMAVGTIPMCIYTRFSLAGTLTMALLGSSVDLVINNPGVDVVSAGVTMLPYSSINVGGSEQTLVNGAVTLTPSVSISAASTTVRTISGATTTIIWSVNGNEEPTTCTATGSYWSGGRELSGSESTPSMNPSSTPYRYGLRCTNTYGSTTATTTVTVVDRRIPITSLSTSPSTHVTWPGTSNIIWSVFSDPGYEATMCLASGDWSGDDKDTVSGSETTGSISANKSYTLRCGNQYGTTTASASVTLYTPPGPSDPCANNDLSDESCGAGTGTTQQIVLNNADGTVTKFFVIGQKLLKQIETRDSPPVILSRQNLTAPDLYITDATFTKTGRGMKVVLKLERTAQADSIQTFTVSKTFKTTATTRSNAD